MEQELLVYKKDMEQELLEYKKDSEWVCFLFGSGEGDGIDWRPKYGCEPNLFWRFMQRVCFGNKWIKR